jgi:predicted DNA-binding transcriptional regulator YafY
MLWRMASTGARTLTLLGLLESRRYWPGTELADRLGVSMRTVRRDVDRLRDLGYPVVAARGVGGGYQLGAGSRLPPLVLDDDEAVALVVGLHTATESEVTGVAQSSIGALVKTLALMPPRLRRRADAMRSVTVPTPRSNARGAVASEVLDAVASASFDEVRLSFTYAARDGAVSERYVEPYRLVVRARRWYLVAFDLHRDDWRTFRLDRITEPRATVNRFDPRPLPADPAVFVQQGIESAPGVFEVRVVVEVPAAVVTERIGRWVTVEALDTAATRVTMIADELEWPLLALDRLDADFRVESPPELVDHVRELGERYRRAIDPGT